MASRARGRCRTNRESYPWVEGLAGLLGGHVDAALHERRGALRTKPAERLEPAAFDLVVRGEEVLDFAEQLLRQVFQRSDILVAPGFQRHADEAIVAAKFAGAVALLRLDHANQARLHQ